MHQTLKELPIIYVNLGVPLGVPLGDMEHLVVHGRHDGKKWLPLEAKMDFFKNLAKSWNKRKTAGHDESIGLDYLAMESIRVKKD